MDGKNRASAAATVAEAAVPLESLPPELWGTIGRRLHSHTDILRFRSVCSTWRSLLPSLPRLLPPLPVPCPPEHFPGSTGSIASATVFRVEPSHQSPGTIPSPRGWLIKLSESISDHMAIESASQPESETALKPNSGKVRLLSLLCRLPIIYNGFPGELDLTKFRVTEVFKEYCLIGPNQFPIGLAEKILISSGSPWQDPGDTTAILITKDGDLQYWKSGNDQWGFIMGDRTEDSRYHDIMLYKGQFYVVDNFGTVSWINSSMRVVQFSPLMCGGGNRKHLLELGNDIIVIDRYHQNRFEEVIHFKVYRLDQEWGKWDEVRDLGDMAVFLGTGCSFAVSVRDFDGCPGNCIYFVQSDGSREKTYVFSLANQSIKRMVLWPPYLQIMWPPPGWFSPILCGVGKTIPLQLF